MNELFLSLSNKKRLLCQQAGKYIVISQRRIDSDTVIALYCKSNLDRGNKMECGVNHDAPRSRINLQGKGLARYMYVNYKSINTIYTHR